MKDFERLELSTDRLVLKVLTTAYARRALDFFVRNRAFLQEWSPATSDEFYTVAFHREKLQSDLELMAQGHLLRLHLFRREDTRRETVIGVVTLNNIIRGAFQSCHLGYQIAERAANQGLMTEALRRVVAYAFDELRLHRVEANVMPRNQRSRRVVRKLGFAEEGLSRKYLKINGVWEDHIHYVLLNDDV
ncbi:MAG TPA: GNAT family N-acetyltransferase [Roseiflexaceae bacterium]